MIFQIIGTPDDISCVSDERARHYLKSFGKMEKTPFNSIFEYLPVDIEDFLQRSLKFNPNERMSVTQALNHPLFNDVRQTYSQYLQISGVPINLELNNLTK